MVFTIFFLLAAARLASASAVSTSVFPNSACAGASSQSGFVGIGKVVLSSGEIEIHCGCPSDNLPQFEACPSSPDGESVCNSVLDLERGTFTASCDVVPCAGSDCPTTVVNTVVVDEADCLYQGKGLVGFSSYAGESKCSCSSSVDSVEEDDEFTVCESPANGRGTCVSTDSDFLGQSLVHQETVKCGVVCDKDYFLTPGGSCTKIEKRQVVAPAGPSGSFHTAAGPSGQVKVGPSATHAASAGASADATSSRHGASASPHATGAAASSHHGASTSPRGTAAANSHRGASASHHAAAASHHAAAAAGTSSRHHASASPHATGAAANSHHGASTSPRGTAAAQSHRGASASFHAVAATSSGVNHAIAAPHATGFASHHGASTSPRGTAAAQSHRGASASFHAAAGTASSPHHALASPRHGASASHSANTALASPRHGASATHSPHANTALAASQRHHASATHSAGAAAGTAAAVATDAAQSSRHGPSAIHSAGQTAVAPGASQRAARSLFARSPEPAAEEFVLAAEVCESDERVCSVGGYGDFTCVRLDDVNECGGCSGNGTAKNCLEITGIATATCLRGECVVRSCLSGFLQTAEGVCSPKLAI